MNPLPRARDLCLLALALPLLSQVGPPRVNPDQVLNAASFTPDLAPGSLVAINGTFLAPSPASADERRALPTRLNGVSVRLGVIDLPLLAVSPERINAHIPFQVRPGSYDLVASVQGRESAPVTIEIKPVAPALFLIDGDRVNAFTTGGIRITDSSPAADDAEMTLYATGLGPVAAPPAVGQPSLGYPGAALVSRARVRIGATEPTVLSAGLVPGRIGLYEIRVKLACPGPGNGCPMPGIHEVTVLVDGVSSAPARITTTITAARFAPLPLPFGCAEAVIDRTTGKPIVPPGTQVIDMGIVTETDGLVADLYPNIDTSTDDWYANPAANQSGCPWNIGGVEPPPSKPPIVPGVEDVAKTMLQALELVDSLPKPGKKMRDLNSIVVPPGFQPPPDPCSVPVAQLSLSMRRFCELLAGAAFGGKDVILVHGFSLQQALDAAGGATRPRWPVDAVHFTSGGYWHTEALNYWQSHINRFLAGKPNRYMVVGWSTAQRMPYAVHTTLHQIAHAMVYGTGVQFTMGDPRLNHGFCARGCVIVSHSTGGPVADIAMTAANNGTYGNLAFIHQAVKTHVALAGAFQGSNLAALLIAGSTLAGGAPCSVLKALFNAVTCPVSTAALLNSVTFDLAPPVMNFLWAGDINSTKVPVVTLAGNANALPNVALQGFDDGVVSMDSACGRSPWFSPSWVSAWPGFRFFDMGLATSDFPRSVGYYFNQWWWPKWAQGCTPYKAPWGMLQPSLSAKSPSLFRKNHFAFFQSAEDHGQLPDGSLPGREESRSVMDPQIYSFVKSSVKNIEVQTSMGWLLQIKFPFMPTIKWWVWKRTYHRPWNSAWTPTAQYAYDYVK